jgi:hypothetical protein
MLGNQGMFALNHKIQWNVIMAVIGLISMLVPAFSYAAIDGTGWEDLLKDPDTGAVDIL